MCGAVRLKHSLSVLRLSAFLADVQASAWGTRDIHALGCYPLTAAIRSQATTLDDIVEEMRLSTTSERQGRLIDHDEAGSMESKKREGYF